MIGFELATMCLALNIYWEAGFEPVEGKYAVAFVTINRVKLHDTDVCDVVFQPNQFSWTRGARDRHGKLLAKYRPKGQAWREARAIANAVMGSEVRDFTGGATHYYAQYIAEPKWVPSLTYVGKYGQHYFYR